jgi:transposase
VILYDQRRLRGDDVLVTRPVRATFTFLFKAEMVHRALGGETYMDLAKEFDLSSTRLIQRWVQAYRDGGDEGLRGEPPGRPRISGGNLHDPSELERLQQENERLRAENSFLGKVRALKAPGRRLKF